MKKLMLSSIWVLFTLSAFSQTVKYDPTAVLILDRMSDIIGQLHSCSYKTNASHDEYVPEYGMVKQFVNSEVNMNYWNIFCIPIRWIILCNIITNRKNKVCLF